MASGRVFLAAAVALTAVQLFACAAVAKDGKRCTRTPCSGSRYCWLHGGTDKASQPTGKTEAGKTPQRKTAAKADARRKPVDKPQLERDAATAGKDSGTAKEKCPRKVEAVTSATPKASQSGS